MLIIVLLIALAIGRVWDEFTIYLLQNDGQLYGLCPVLPYGCAVDGIRVKHYLKLEKQQGHNNALANDAQYQARLAWIEETFGLDKEDSVPEKFNLAMAPTTPELRRPLLQGPVSLHHDKVGGIGSSLITLPYVCTCTTFAPFFAPFVNSACLSIVAQHQRGLHVRLVQVTSILSLHWSPCHLYSSYGTMVAAMVAVWHHHQRRTRYMIR